MKRFILSAILGGIFSSSLQADCSQREAQFSGVVKEFRTQPGTCYFKIKFHSYSMSTICPLDIDIAQARELVDSECKYRNGQSLRGVLVWKNGALFID